MDQVNADYIYIINSNNMNPKLYSLFQDIFQDYLIPSISIDQPDNHFIKYRTLNERLEIEKEIAKNGLDFIANIYTQYDQEIDEYRQLNDKLSHISFGIPPKKFRYTAMFDYQQIYNVLITSSSNPSLSSSSIFYFKHYLTIYQSSNNFKFIYDDDDDNLINNDNIDARLLFINPYDNFNAQAIHFNYTHDIPIIINDHDCAYKFDNEHDFYLFIDNIIQLIK